MLGRRAVGAAKRAEARPLHSDRRVPGLQRRADPAGEIARGRRSQRLRRRRPRPGHLSFSRRHQRGLRPVPQDLRPGARQARHHVGQPALDPADPELRLSGDPVQSRGRQQGAAGRRLATSAAHLRPAGAREEPRRQGPGGARHRAQQERGWPASSPIPSKPRAGDGPR